MLKLFFKVEGLRDEADKAKRECLEVKKIAEEKEVLFKQEQAALRKVRLQIVLSLRNRCVNCRQKFQCMVTQYSA